MKKIKGYRFDKFFFDIDNNKLYDETDHSRVKLSDRSLKILLTLIESPVPVSSKDLIDDPTIDFETDNNFSKNAKDKLYAAIHELRGKLKDGAIIKKDGGYALNYSPEPVHEDSVNPVLDEPIVQPSPSSIAFEEKATSPKRFLKKAFYAASLLLNLALLLALFFSGAGDDGLTKITIDNAKVHLDLNDGWNDLSEADREKSEKLSRASFNIEYQVRKHFKTDVFSHRLGTSSNIPPEWESANIHPISDVEDITDIDKKCSATATYAKMLYFDISREKVREPFNLMFKIIYFNAHNRQKNEYQSYFIHRPIEVLEFRVSFPNSKPYPKATRLMRANNCADQFQEQKKQNSPESPKEYVVENSDEKTIIWHVENPLVNKIYRIEWDWQ